MRCIAALVCVTVWGVVGVASVKPHIFFLLVDDYGHADASWHRTSDPSTEVVTPNMQALVNSGIELDRHYVFEYCSPTRSALQTGRNPVHVNILNSPLGQHNPKDLIGGYQGIPRNMTGIATKLKSAGYATHQAGKWHAGMAIPEQTPVGRGYDTSLNYFDACNDYWDNRFLQPCTTDNMATTFNVTDLWDSHGPAKGLNNSIKCSQANQLAGCVYEDELIAQRVLDTIAAHDPTTPFFFVWTPHSVHEPYEVPQTYLDKFSAIDVPVRQYYMAMVNFIDDKVGAVVAALKARGMWDDLLFVMSSDNGGPLGDGSQNLTGNSGANNFPLRGGKMGNMDGGVRANAFVSGGLVPQALRGSKSEGFIAIEDWYATFCALAGVDPTDDDAAEAGLPPIDSLNMWPYLSGAVPTSPREYIWLGHSDGTPGVGNTTVQGVIEVATGYKYLIGSIAPAFVQGPTYPNASSVKPTEPLVCGDPNAAHKKYGPGCLFDIIGDPNETTDLASSHPAIATRLRALIAKEQRGVYNPDRGHEDKDLFCSQALKYGGFVGPFVVPMPTPAL